jgi:hypothetical protein
LTREAGTVAEPTGSPTGPAAGGAARAAKKPSTERPEGEPLSGAAALAAAKPDPETVRKEVAENPHQTPRSYLVFASEMAARMSEAKKSEEKATAVFSELEDCLRDSKLQKLKAVQALCLSNAGTLSNRYPALKPRHEQLVKSADPDVVKINEHLSF